MGSTDCLRAASLVVAGILGFAATGQVPADDNPRTAYFSTGDNQDLLWLPLESRESVEAVFDALHRGYRVDRIWWRGGQDTIWGNCYVIREENRPYGRLWQWFKHLAYEKVGTNRIAVKAAHDRGMKIWMVDNVFDHGSGPDVGFAGFPYAAEDRLRIEHPEWVPVNRYGTWRQGGPLEFCYPEVRRILAERYVKYVVEEGYDGLALLTYVENFSQRYEDEFGFNPPIVAEFSRRYGVDIRTQPFDKKAWARLRGEYLTQFLRELHAASAKHGTKIAVAVDGTEPHWPSMWNVAGGLRSAGRIHLDIETWIKERLVDEINVYAPSSDEAIGYCRRLCEGSRTAATAFRTRGELPPVMPRIMFLATDIESGFPWENYINYDDERIPPQPSDAINGADAFARRRVLWAVGKGKQRISLGQVTAATKDRDLFVRRNALRALEALADPAAIPAVEAALEDPENSVRWQAALVLGKLAGPRCLAKLLAGLERPDGTHQFRFRAVPQVIKTLNDEGKLGPEAKGLLATKLVSESPEVREATLYAFQQVGAPATPEVEAALLRIIRNDPSPYAREMAMVNLRSTFGSTERVLAALKEASEGADAAVQVRAVVQRSVALRTKGTAAARAQALAELTGFLGRYGERCARPDAAWGWREVGNAILAFEREGERALQDLLGQRKDLRLAELAWRILYLRQGDQPYRCTEAEDRESHRRHPLLSFGNAR